MSALAAGVRAEFCGHALRPKWLAVFRRANSGGTAPRLMSRWPWVEQPSSISSNAVARRCQGKRATASGRSLILDPTSCGSDSLSIGGSTNPVSPCAWRCSPPAAQHREAVGAPQLRVSEVEAFGEDLVVQCRSRLRRFGFESGCPQALFFLARLRLPNLGRLLGAARRRSCVRPRASRSGAWWCSVQLLVALAFLVGTWRKGPQSSTTPRVAITFSVAEHCSTSSFLPKLRHCLAFQYDQCGPRAATAQK